MGYNKAFLSTLNISKGDYTDGHWTGNSDLDERVIFRNATYNIEDIIYNTIVKFVNGEKKSFKEIEIHNITTFEVFQSTLGRCFELTLELLDVAVVSVEFNANFPIYIYVNMPGQTTNENSKSKVEVKMQQRLFIDVTYEVFQMSDEEKCFKYSQEYSYDNCNFDGLEKYFTEVGCSAPYVKSNVSVCKDKLLISKANTNQNVFIFYLCDWFA